jgi:16S rRNA (guanine527-N7)-methyltransferase
VPADRTAELAATIDTVLPAALPNRSRLVAGCARHAALLLAANESLNLTRITAPRELAVKHVLDSVLPWRRLFELFPRPAASAGKAPGDAAGDGAGASLRSADARRAALAGAPLLLDLGSGGGYPGIPLALLLPHVRVVLCESIRKKAAFLADVAAALSVTNVEVEARRAEELLQELPAPVAAVTARAVDSARELLRLLKPARGRFGRLLLWKGQGVEIEVAQAAKDAEKQLLAAAISWRGELPDDHAPRCLVEYAPA